MRPGIIAVLGRSRRDSIRRLPCAARIVRTDGPQGVLDDEARKPMSSDGPWFRRQRRTIHSLGPDAVVSRTDELIAAGSGAIANSSNGRVRRPVPPGTTEGLISRTAARTDGLSAFDVAGVRSSPDVRDVSPQAIVELLL